MDNVFDGSDLLLYYKNQYVDTSSYDFSIEERTQKHTFFNSSGGMFIYLKVVRHEVYTESSDFFSFGLKSHSPTLVKNFTTVEIDTESASPRKFFDIRTELSDKIIRYHSKKKVNFRGGNTEFGITGVRHDGGIWITGGEGLEGHNGGREGGGVEEGDQEGCSGDR